MPREPLDFPRRVDSLSILNHEGQLDTQLEPKLPDDDLRRLYRTMRASRLLDERCLHLQRQGRLGTYGPSKGQEAASLGVAYALGKDDWLVPSFRETCALLWRGWPMAKFLFWWGGHEEGSIVAEGINDLPLCVPVASQCQYGMGVAWGSKLRGEDTVCATFVGDGGTSEGDFHEAMNFAAVYNVPLIMVVQNNHWAISIPRQKQTVSQTIAQKAIAYGMDALQVDGNDLLAMIVATREAVEKARTGGGPTFIEAVTYRLGMHTTADDPRKYRCAEEVKLWEGRDPLPRFRKYLEDKKLLDEKIHALLEEEVRRLLDEAVEEYEAYRVDPNGLFKYLYRDMTPDLKRQMAELQRAVQPESAAENPPADRYSRVL